MSNEVVADGWLVEGWVGAMDSPASADCHATVRIAPASERLGASRRGSLVLAIEVRGSGQAVAIIPPNLVGPEVRKLRRLATFARQQGRIPTEMGR